MKTTIITNMPTPYRLPLWKAFSHLVDLNVICISAMEKNRHWKIEADDYITILKSYHFYFHKRDWPLHFSFPFALLIKLVRENPSVVIVTGYDSLQYWEALLYAKIFGKKTVLWSGSTLLSSRSKNKYINQLKSFFIRRFDTYYTYGSQATEYLIHHGADRDSVVTGTNTVDTGYFKQHTTNEMPDRKMLKFLYVGQLLERKGLENTLKAFGTLDRNDWSLAVIGKGPDEEKLKQLVSDLHLQSNVHFLGYKQKEEILGYFSDSHILIMPSYLEVWGLVLNEALASGLFCLSSKYAGATFDLIEEGENGYIIDPLDIDDIVHKIQKTFNVSFDKQKIKNDFIVSPENEAEKLFAAAQEALNQ